jgi:hypothetical protein
MCDRSTNHRAQCPTPRHSALPLGVHCGPREHTVLGFERVFELVAVQEPVAHRAVEGAPAPAPELRPRPAPCRTRHAALASSPGRPRGTGTPTSPPRPDLFSSAGSAATSPITPFCPEASGDRDVVLLSLGQRTRRRAGAARAHRRRLRREAGIVTVGAAEAIVCKVDVGGPRPARPTAR